MWLALITTALADLAEPEHLCGCGPGEPRVVQVRHKDYAEPPPLVRNGDAWELSFEYRMYRLGYRTRCMNLGEGWDRLHTYCGPEGDLPACQPAACGAGTVASRCPDGAACEAVQGAVATCRDWDEATEKRLTVWCKPAESPPAPVPALPAVPSSPHPGGCATAGFPASLAGLLLLSLAARRRSRAS